jgi:uncharacterized membrane protein (DUF106 family)
MPDWSQLSVNVAALLDHALGWLLGLPRDVALVTVAVATSLVLTLARKWFTNQELLSRCAADIRRLKELIRGAKSRRDKPAVQRMKGTINLIKITQLSSEGRVLLWSLVPVALLAFWAIERLQFLPPAAGQPLTLRAYYPLSSVERLTHLVPPEGFDLRSPAVQSVRLDPEGQANGVAEWTLAAREDVADARLVVRHQGRSVVHHLRVDGRVYSTPIQRHAEDFLPVTEVPLPPARFLGVVPGIPVIAFPPWLVAYLLMTILLVPLLRRVLRVN